MSYDNSPQPGDVIPLTWQQQIIWYQSILQPLSPRYHAHVIFRFDTAPEADTILEELRLLNERYPILRTRLVFADGQPMQQVPSPDASHDDVDFSVCCVRSDKLTSEELVTVAGSNEPFDLSGGQLIRWRLLILPSGSAVLVSTEHHLIHDGISSEIMLGSLGIIDHRASDTGYFTYAAGQEPVPASDVRAAAAKCAETVAELFPKLPDYERKEDPFLRLPLPRTLTRQIADAARRNAVSFFAVLFCAFCSALEDIARPDKKFLVGSGVSNRPDALNEATGMFVSTAPVVVAPEEEKSQPDRLREIAAALRSVMKSAHVPPQDIVAALPGRISRGQGGLINVAFSLHEQTRSRASIAGVTGAIEVGAFNGAAKFPVNVIAVRKRDGLDNEVTLLMEGSGDYVTVDDLWAIWGGFTEWLWKLARATPTYPRGVATDVAAAVCSAARRSGHLMALDDGHDRLTYHHLVCLGSALRTRIGSQGHAIGILGRASARFFACAYAAMYAGAVYIPLNTDRPPEDLADMAQRAGCNLIIDLADVPPSPVLVTPGRGALSWRELWQSAAVHTPCAASEPAEASGPAYVIFTSGSTGVPKGVIVRRDSLALLCQWARAELGLSEGTIVAQTMNIGFDGSMVEVWPALSAGAQIKIVPSEIRIDPAKFAQWLTRESVQVCIAPTPVAEMLLEEKWPPDNALRVLGARGSRLHRAMALL